MKKILMICCMLLALNCFAMENSRDGWFGFFNKSTINEKFSWWTETQLRHDLDINKMQQALIRTGLLYKISSDLEAGFLYAYITSDTAKEHRFSLQNTMKYGVFANAVFSHRMRLEYRSRERVKNLPERFRYLLRAQQEINRKIKRVIWDEVFLNLRKDPQIRNDIFAINRLFIGGRYALSSSFSIEAGYLNQYINRPVSKLMEHVAVLYLFFRS